MKQACTFKLLLSMVLGAILLISMPNVSVAQNEQARTELAQDSYQFDNDSQRQVFLSLTAELRCPMCQNQNIADSDAMIAHDMRRKVYQLLQEGQTEQQVIDFMKSRYGDFVHYKPPVTPYTLWLWLLPLIFAVTALFFITRKPKQLDDKDIESKLAQADALLKREE